ncbi:MAG: hypothetical protein ABI425_05235 [Patescibacteria group bacterium]
MHIYPAILTESVPLAEEQLARVVGIPEIEAVQIDIIDGEYADNLTISPIDLIGTNFGELRVDFHLMTIEPVNFIYECKQVENVRAVIAQIERMTSQKEFIREALQFSVQPGLSLDLYTPVESIHEESWEELRVICLMGNLAGHQGEPFKGKVVLDKIREVNEIKKKLDLQQLEVIVDIGVNEDTISQIAKAGADGVAVGSLLWKSEDIEAQLQRLEENAH